MCESGTSFAEVENEDLVMNVKTKYIESLGKKIAYKRFERGPVEVLFLGGHRSTMEKLNYSNSTISNLQKCCEVLDVSLTIFDYFGSGESEGDFKPWNTEDWLINIQDVLGQVLSDKSVILIGSSMGGYLSLLVSLLFPIQIRKVIGIVPGFGASFSESGQDLCLFDKSTGTQIELSLDHEGKAMIASDLDIKCPVHLIRGMRDEKVSSLASKSILDHLPKSTDKKIYNVDSTHSGSSNFSETISILKSLLF